MRLAYVAGSATVVAIGALLLALLLGGGGNSHPHHSARVAPTSPAGTPSPAFLPTELPTGASQLASDINRAQQIIEDPSSTRRELASAGVFEQLATRALEHQTRQARHATLAALTRQAAAGTRANLEAAAGLSGLAAAAQPLPHWEILPPPPPDTLLKYFREAQARFGVPWAYLAAIEFVETRFGRVHGLSSAGAQGPMQFLPATWARYGSGSINNQRDAILGAARFLIANGAPGDLAGALYHYNPSRDYVAAVEHYASRMRSDSRAYYGYYYWQVLYQSAGGLVILPVGYPKLQPVPVH
jgi:hypothetical protein